MQTGDSVMIAGAIITGNEPKKVIVRALGPSLAQAGINDLLVDPVLELYGPNGSLITTNDNWKETQQADIEGTGLPPNEDAESAIVATLPPGSYTAVVRGQDGSSGIALVEIYDLSSGGDSRLANISTRAFVQTDENVLIGGFILGGNDGFADVILRGIGPSLASSEVPETLADPILELRDRNGELLLGNDNWQDDSAQATQISASGVAPNDPLESAMAVSLPPGHYTTILAGVNGGDGIGLVEIYNISN